MVEVFRTNVRTSKEAKVVLKRLQTAFPGYRANFDLEDRDNILRIETAEKTINRDRLIRLLREESFEITVLPDVVKVQENRSRD